MTKENITVLYWCMSIFGFCYFSRHVCYE